ncbi:MAG: LysR family transcriptional regulator [Methanobrevibacter sp.]|jgi:molybdate transport system regulatory protein|nr:LysR family transcriptional regulator [Methanobrevibacter sp.]
MVDVKAGVEYKINIGRKSFLLDKKKYKLLDFINSQGSITKAAKLANVSYRTALNHIDKIEDSLDIKLVETTKGGFGGGGGSTLTSEGYSILKECKKINAIMELHREVNEIESTVLDIDEAKGVMKIKIKDLGINIPLNSRYKVGDKILALISYDNIFLMLTPQESSIRNVLKGRITEMSLEKEAIRIKINVDGINLYSDITVSAAREMNLTLSKKIYVGFKAMSVATLKM